jgi:hypothetical protein
MSNWETLLVAGLMASGRSEGVKASGLGISMIGSLAAKLPLVCQGKVSIFLAVTLFLLKLY